MNPIMAAQDARSVHLMLGFPKGALDQMWLIEIT